jgi:hypothetical protein
VEAGTTVLSFGGPPTFTPSAWEWKFRAAAQREDPRAARATIADGLAVHPQAGGLHYELACLEAVSGDTEAALAALSRAVAVASEFAKVARSDEDFASLRGHPEFESLVAAE